MSWQEPTNLELQEADSTRIVERVHRVHGRVEEVRDSHLVLAISRMWQEGRERGFRAPRPRAMISTDLATVRIITSDPEAVNRRFVQGSVGVLLGALVLVFLLTVTGGFR